MKTVLKWKLSTSQILKATLIVLSFVGTFSCRRDDSESTQTLSSQPSQNETKPAPQGDITKKTLAELLAPVKATQFCLDSALMRMDLGDAHPILTERDTINCYIDKDNHAPALFDSTTKLGDVQKEYLLRVKKLKIDPAMGIDPKWTFDSQVWKNQHPDLATANPESLRACLRYCTSNLTDYECKMTGNNEKACNGGLFSASTRCDTFKRNAMTCDEAIEQHKAKIAASKDNPSSN